MTNAEYVESLRKVADWFESHPEVKPPHDADEIGLYNIHSRAEMETVARAFGSCEKEYTDSGYFKLKKKVGDIEIVAVASREQVCNRKIVGSKFIPEQVIPARTVDVVEWECFETPSLLAKKEPIDIDAPLAQAIRHDQQIERGAQVNDNNDIPF